MVLRLISTLFRFFVGWRFIFIIHQVPPVFFRRPSVAGFAVMFFGKFQQFKMFERFCGGFVFSVHISKLRGDAVRRYVYNGNNTCDLVPPESDFISREYFFRRLCNLPVYRDVILFTGFCNHVSRLIIPHAPQIFIDSHVFSKFDVK